MQMKCNFPSQIFRALESDNKSIQNVSPEIDRHTPLSGGDGDRKGSDTGSIKSLGSQSSQLSTATAATNPETIEELEGLSSFSITKVP